MANVPEVKAALGIRFPDDGEAGTWRVHSEG
jgi:hypothetical protein